MKALARFLRKRVGIAAKDQRRDRHTPGIRQGFTCGQSFSSGKMLRPPAIVISSSGEKSRL